MELSYLLLEKLYIKYKKSVFEIAKFLKCSENKVNYWIKKYKINKRSISDAMYIKHNSNGDPFKFNYPKNLKKAKLFGLGIGLYWGEGNKANKNSIRLGNTDPNLIKKFIEFLIKFFSIKRKDLSFGLQLFSDVDVDVAMDFWVKMLKINKSQIGKPVITISGSLGNYKKKNQCGVLTVMYHNKKLKNLLMNLLPM